MAEPTKNYTVEDVEERKSLATRKERPRKLQAKAIAELAALFSAKPAPESPRPSPAKKSPRAHLKQAATLPEPGTDPTQIDTVKDVGETKKLNPKIGSLEEEEKPMKIADLAKLLNPAVVFGPRPQQNLDRSYQAPPRTDFGFDDTFVGGVTAKGLLDHMNFLMKPRTPVAKKKGKSN